jgi:hypothetical protein
MGFFRLILLWCLLLTQKEIFNSTSIDFTIVLLM